jgi:hypothetical protein
MTLAATIKVGSEQKIVTTYQYICIKIAALSNDAPCFQKTPVNSDFTIQNGFIKCFIKGITYTRTNG